MSVIRYGKGALTDTFATLYTVPLEMLSVVKTITFSNTHTEEVTVELKLDDVAFEYKLEAGSNYQFGAYDQVLYAGETIQAKSSVDGVVKFYISGKNVLSEGLDYTQWMEQEWNEWFNGIVGATYVVNSEFGVLGDLTTTEKTTMVSAVNEVDGNIGDLDALVTTDKSSLVGAVNEVNGEVGDLSILETTEKGSLVGAVNEVNGEVDAHLAQETQDAHIPQNVGIGTLDIDINNKELQKPKIKNYSETAEVATGVTGSRTINLENGNVFRHTLSGTTTYAFSNPPANGVAGSFTLIIQQPTTARAIIFPASVKWADGEIPDAPPASRVAVYTFITTNGGSRWYGFQAGNEMVI